MPPRNPCQKVTPLKCKVSKFDGQDAVPVEYTLIVRLSSGTRQDPCGGCTGPRLLV